MQLDLLEESDAAPALASFRTDARLRLWGAGACASCALAVTWLGYAHRVLPLVAGPASAAFLLWSAYLAVTFAGRRAIRYTLTAQRLEIERGVFARHLASVELWRVRDLVLDQTMMERLRGVGRITLYSTDQVEPELDVGPVAGARPLFARMRDAVAAARKDAKVVPLG